MARKGALVLSLTLAVLSGAPVHAGQYSAALQADFQHFNASGMYETQLYGQPLIDFAAEPSGAAHLSFPVGRGLCSVAMSWVRGAAGAFGQTDACLASATVTEADFNAWMGGSGQVDPSLIIPLASSPPPAGTAQEWINPGQMNAQLFLLGCGSQTYRKYGDFQIAATELTIDLRSNGTAGQLLVVQTSTGLLNDVAPDVWANVRSDCGGTAIGLPEASVPGENGSFLATASVPAPGPDPVSDELAALDDAIDRLVDAGILQPRSERQLTGKIDATGIWLSKARPDKARRQLVAFRKAVDGLAAKGTLPAGDAADLLSRAGTVEALIVVAPPSPELDPESYCLPALLCSVSPCPDNAVYHVSRKRVTGTRDGTAERPFASVADALAQAETAGVCGVDVLVDRGSYTGNLTITRNTRILGLLGKRPEIRGSVVNTGPYELRLDAVDLAPSGNGVFVDHPCATTFLEQVEIADAVGYGIRQSGGTLDGRGVLVFRTQMAAGAPTCPTIPSV